jgi:hypothetical protein
MSHAAEASHTSDNRISVWAWIFLAVVVLLLVMGITRVFAQDPPRFDTGRPIPPPPLPQASSGRVVSGSDPTFSGTVEGFDFSVPCVANAKAGGITVAATGAESVANAQLILSNAKDERQRNIERGFCLAKSAISRMHAVRPVPVAVQLVVPPPPTFLVPSFTVISGNEVVDGLGRHWVFGNQHWMRYYRF